MGPSRHHVAEDEHTRVTSQKCSENNGRRVRYKHIHVAEDYAIHEHTHMLHHRDAQKIMADV